MSEILNALSYWGLENATITPMHEHSDTSWDVDGEYVLKRYRSAEDALRSVKFSSLLVSGGVPCGTFMATKDGELISPDGLYCLRTKLMGEHPNLFEEPALAYEFGCELARLHIALSKIEQQTSCVDIDIMDTWRDSIKPSLRDVPEHIVKSVDTDFCEVFPKLPRQLIHRDVHCQNVLFDGGHLTGWLDFDLSLRNVRIFDIAYMLAGLLVGNIGDSEKLDIWHKIRHLFVQGHNEVSVLSDDEQNALPLMMIVIEFLFVWWWGEEGNTEERGVALELAYWLCDEWKIGIAD